MVFLIHTELRCTVNHTSDLICKLFFRWIQSLKLHWMKKRVTTNTAAADFDKQSIIRGAHSTLLHPLLLQWRTAVMQTLPSNMNCRPTATFYGLWISCSGSTEWRQQTLQKSAFVSDSPLLQSGAASSELEGHWNPFFRTCKNEYNSVINYSNNLSVVSRVLLSWNWKVVWGLHEVKTSCQLIAFLTLTIWAITLCRKIHLYHKMGGV